MRKIWTQSKSVFLEYTRNHIYNVEVLESDALEVITVLYQISLSTT